MRIWKKPAQYLYPGSGIVFFPRDLSGPQKLWELIRPETRGERLLAGWCVVAGVYWLYALVWSLL